MYDHQERWTDLAQIRGMTWMWQNEYQNKYSDSENSIVNFLHHSVTPGNLLPGYSTKYKLEG